ncbi:MAG TPA: tetratricopeptide repeat protein [Solirubrobacteraceae bacterium]|nr:tetratricopeptide repeat protein [Solirubrobacteraceae bacterium]
MTIATVRAPLPFSRAAGASLRWALGPGLGVAASLLLIAAGAWSAIVLIADPEWLPKPSWSDVALALALLSGVFVLRFVVRSRRRVVAEEFTDFTGDETSRTRGVADLLADRLSALHSLYTTVEERRVLSTAVETSAGASLAGRISLGGEGELDAKSFDSELDVKVGPLAVPVKALATMLTGLGRGSRIRGSVHRHGDRVAMLAELSGRRRRSGWSVERYTRADDWKEEIPDMVEELAYRIFTHLVVGRSARWEATKRFAQALRAYRESLTAHEQSARKLDVAERLYVEAVGEDSQFDLALYNLGVLYFERGQNLAARRAFVQAIELNPERRESYSGLARVEMGLGRFDVALWFCERARAGARNDAARFDAYTLEGNIYSYAPDIEDRQVRMARAGRRALRAARAVLRRIYLRPSGATPDERRREESRAVIAFTNLGIAHVELAARRRMRRRWHLMRARSLAHRAIRLRTEFAAPFDMLLNAGVRGETAVRAARSAVQLAPTDPARWSELALTFAHARRAREAKAAAAVAIDSPSRATPATLSSVVATLDALGDQAAAARVDDMRTLRDELPEPPTQESIEAVEDWLSWGDWEARDWARAQALTHTVPGVADDVAAERLREAIVLLEPEHREEIREQGLRGRLAYTLLHIGRTAEAVTEARVALAEDPVNPYELTTLGHAEESAGNLSAARDRYELAVLRAPRSADARLRLMNALLALRHVSANAERRRELLATAVEHGRTALDLLPIHEVRALGDLHLKLSAMLAAMGRVDEGLRHVGAGRLLEPERALPLLQLGELSLRLNMLQDAALAYEATLGLARAAPGLTDPDAPAAPSDRIDVFEGSEIARGILVAECLLGQAEVLLARRARTDEARALARAARREAKGANVPQRRDVEARALACMGWARAVEGDDERARAELEAAAATHPEPLVYLRLGTVLARSCGDDEALRRRAVDCAVLSRALHADEQHSVELDALERALQAAGADGLPEAGRP